MKNQNALMFGAAVVLVTAGCGYKAPYKSSGPSYAEEGVQVGLAGVRCYVNRGGDPLTDLTDEDQVGLDLKLQINNNSSQVAEVSEGHIRLAEPEVPTATPAAPRRSMVVALLPGETKQVPIKFMPPGVTDCHHSFELEFADSVEIAGTPVGLQSIDFQAKP